MVTYSFSLSFFEQVNGRYDYDMKYFEILSFSDLKTAKKIHSSFNRLGKSEVLENVRGYESKYKEEKFQEYLKNLDTPIDFAKTIRKIKEAIRSNKPITGKLFKPFMNYYKGRDVSSKTVLRLEKVINGFIYTLSLPVDKNTHMESYISRIYEIISEDFSKNFYKMDMKEFTEYIKNGNKPMYHILSVVKREDLCSKILKYLDIETSELITTEIITS